MAQEAVKTLFEKYDFVDAVIVEGVNCFLMEHIEPREHLVARFSKYRGSNGTLVMDRKSRTLVTDSRYEVQNAEKTYDVEKVIILGRPYRNVIDALVSLTEEYKVVGIYGDNFSYAFLESLINGYNKKDVKILFTTKKEEINRDFDGKIIYCITDNSVDQNEIEELIDGFKDCVKQLPSRLTGVNHFTKLVALTSQIVVPNMKIANKFVYVVNKCEFVSWLLNLRGKGSSINQICRGILVFYAEKANIISEDEFTVNVHVTLLASRKQFKQETYDKLHIKEGDFSTYLRSSPFYDKGEAGEILNKIKCNLCLDILEPEELQNTLGKIREIITPNSNTEKIEPGNKTCIVLDNKYTNISLVVSLTGGKLIYEDQYFHIIEKIPIYSWISNKHPFEIDCIRKGLIKESTAFTTFIYKAKNIYKFDEKDALSVERRLEDELYSEQKKQGAIMKSFNSIIGINQHSAVIHYEAHGEANESIPADGLFEKSKASVVLVDAGAQYENALTDTTRTFVKLDCDANATEEDIPLDLKMAYTAVLKGNIALARAIVPFNTPLFNVDTLTRVAMISARGGPYTYGHGTGHGVGCGLDVHEGEYSMNWSFNERTNIALVPGNLVTDEPGCYYLGKWGIRLENIMLCKESLTHPGCIEFEPLTYIPFDKSLIIIEDLTNEELVWLRNYNKKIVDYLSSRLEGQALAWLKEEIDY